MCMRDGRAGWVDVMSTAIMAVSARYDYYPVYVLTEQAHMDIIDELVNDTDNQPFQTSYMVRIRALPFFTSSQFVTVIESIVVSCIYFTSYLHCILFRILRKCYSFITSRCNFIMCSLWPKVSTRCSGVHEAFVVQRQRRHHGFRISK